MEAAALPAHETAAALAVPLGVKMGVGQNRH